MFDISIDKASGSLVIKRHGFTLYSLKGDITFVGLKAPLAITGATNATPIVITTAVAHGLLSASRISINGVLGNLAANGNFFAKPLTSTTFEIYQYQNLSGAIVGNAVGNGVYVANTGLLSSGGITTAVTEDTIQITCSSLSSPSGTADYVTLPASRILTINGVAPTDTTLNGLIASLSAIAANLNSLSTKNLSAGRIYRPSGAVSYTVANKPIIGGSLTVSGATNATPIVVTTSTHKLVDRQPVTIAGVNGGSGTNANGNYYAKVTGYSSTTFALYEDANLTKPVVGNANFASNGTAAPIGILKDVVNFAGASGYIIKLRVMTNTNTWGTSAAVLKIHFFHQPPTGLVDATAYPLLYDNVEKRVYPLTLDAMFTEGSGSDASATGWIGALGFDCADGVKDLYYVLELVGASTTTLAPIANQEFYVEVLTDLG